MAHWLIEEQTAPIKQAVTGLKEAVLPTESGLPATFDGRNRIIMGQDYPVLGPGETWPMANRALFFGLQAARAELRGVSERLTLFMDASTTVDTALQARLALSEAASAAQLTRIQAEETESQMLHLWLDAVAAKAEATRLANLATDAKATAAQSAAVAAQTSANTAQAAAATAQTKADADAVAATAALTAAQAAQARADAAAASAATAITAAAAAQSTANTALSEERALNARMRVLSVTYPAQTLTVATPLLIPVVLSPAFADALYSEAFARVTTTTLLNVDLAVVNKTASGFSVKLTNTSLASLAIPAGTLDLIVIKNS